LNLQVVKLLLLHCDQDLPTGQFDEARTAIDAKYTEIERSLIAEFIKSHRSNDRMRMKDLVRNANQGCQIKVFERHFSLKFDLQ
jgi:hypothetical protein